MRLRARALRQAMTGKDRFLFVFPFLELSREGSLTVLYCNGFPIFLFSFARYAIQI